MLSYHDFALGADLVGYAGESSVGILLDQQVGNSAAGDIGVAVRDGNRYSLRGGQNVTGSAAMLAPATIGVLGRDQVRYRPPGRIGDLVGHGCGRWRYGVQCVESAEDGTGFADRPTPP